MSAARNWIPPSRATSSYEEINWDGLEFTRAHFETVTHLDKSDWTQELKLHAELFEQLAYHLPQALVDTKAALAQRIEAA